MSEKEQVICTIFKSFVADFQKQALLRINRVCLGGGNSEELKVRVSQGKTLKEDLAYWSIELCDISLEEMTPFEGNLTVC